LSQIETQQICDRLDAIIRLLLEAQRKDLTKVTVGAQIAMLESAGLKGKDVAKILGIKVGQLFNYRLSAKCKEPTKRPSSPS